MPAKNVPPYAPLDLTTSDEHWIADVSGGDLLRLQAVVDSGTWGAATIAVETSLDAETWVDLSSAGEGPAADLDSGDEDLILGPYFLEAVKLIRFRVATNQGGACEVSVHLGLGSTSPLQAVRTYGP